MDYKYIEQLLERYWNCDTSIEEEQILRSFFNQKDVPSNLIQYKQLFVYQVSEKEVKLDEKFDKKILSMIEKPVVKAERLTLYRRCMPLFKAAAVITVLFSVGAVMQRSMDKENGNLIYVYDQYKESSTDPQVAYDATLPIDTLNKIVKDTENKVKNN